LTEDDLAEQLANETAAEEHLYNHYPIQAIWKKYRYPLLIDLLFGLMVYNIFNVAKQGLILNKEDSEEYLFYDQFCFFYGFPTLFCLLLILTMLENPKNHSITTRLLSQTRIFTLLGRCSLAIYLLQDILMYFWIGLAYEGIKEGIWWPYTQSFYSSNSPEMMGEKKSELFDDLRWKIAGCILVVGICHLIQKVYQEQFVSYLHIHFFSNCSIGSNTTSPSAASSSISSPLPFLVKCCKWPFSLNQSSSGGGEGGNSTANNGTTTNRPNLGSSSFEERQLNDHFCPFLFNPVDKEREIITASYVAPQQRNAGFFFM
jgi:hypothetical protein